MLFNIIADTIIYVELWNAIVSLLKNLFEIIKLVFSLVVLYGIVAVPLMILWASVSTLFLKARIDIRDILLKIVITLALIITILISVFSPWS